MILFINTSKEMQLDVFLIKQTQIIDKLIKRGNYKVSENLLKMIDKLIKKNKLDFKNLKGIIAVSGPGPFTSLRIGVAVANTLAYALKIPAVGLINKKQKLTDEQLIKLGLQKLSKAKTSNYISPFYDREPNITKSKNKIKI